MREKSVNGFRTGDLVRADVPKGKKTGVHTGRVAVRRTGSFNIQTGSDVVQGISHKHCRLLQRSDGYGYAWSIVTPNPGNINFPVSSHHQTHPTPPTKKKKKKQKKKTKKKKKKKNPPPGAPRPPPPPPPPPDAALARQCCFATVRQGGVSTGVF